MSHSSVTRCTVQNLRCSRRCVRRRVSPTLQRRVDWQKFTQRLWDYTALQPRRQTSTVLSALKHSYHSVETRHCFFIWFYHVFNMVFINWRHHTENSTQILIQQRVLCYTYSKSQCTVSYTFVRIPPMRALFMCVRWKGVVHCEH
jgi:hypothetical protein